jgi:hypothetical protein
LSKAAKEDKNRYMHKSFYRLFGMFHCIAVALTLTACAPRVVEMTPQEGPPGTLVNLSMEHLVGWPRVEIGGHTMDFYQMKLLAKDPERAEVRGEDLIWIEDKILQFRVPSLSPGEYAVTIHDDKGPPGDKVYSFLETTAYVAWPPVWPFVFRSNEAKTTFRVLPGE